LRRHATEVGPPHRRLAEHPETDSTRDDESDSGTAHSAWCGTQLTPVSLLQNHASSPVAVRRMSASVVWPGVSTMSLWKPGPSLALTGIATLVVQWPVSPS
jgi:hypothetical protein